MVVNFKKIEIYYALFCIICNINLYKSASNCPAGYYSMKLNENCFSCPPGTEKKNGNTCENCAAGYYSIGIGKCFKCPRGFISEIGSVACQECPKGTYELYNTQCKKCSAGTYSD